MYTSHIGIGTWSIGGWHWGDSDPSVGERTLSLALSLGATLIDTAPVYGFGGSERIISKVLKTHSRKDIQVATKCGLNWNNVGTPFFSTQYLGKNINVYRSLTPKQMQIELEQSLKNLGTDYVDYYLTHWQDPLAPIEETVDTLERFKKKGMILEYGACNAHAAQLAKYNTLGGLKVSQEMFHLLDQKALKDQIPYCIKNKVSFWSYSPFASGLLTGKNYTEFPKEDGRSHSPSFQKPPHEMIHKLKELSTQLGITLPQLVLLATLNKSGINKILPGPRAPEQVKEIFPLPETPLSEETMIKIIKIISEASAEKNNIS